MKKEKSVSRFRFRLIGLFILLATTLIAGCASFQLDTGVISISHESTPTAPIQTNVPDEQLVMSADEAAREDQLAVEEDEQFLVIEEIIIGMLFVAVMVGIVAHRLRLPYTVGLVLMGLALALGVQLDVSV